MAKAEPQAWYSTVFCDRGVVVRRRVSPSRRGWHPTPEAAVAAHRAFFLGQIEEARRRLESLEATLAEFDRAEVVAEGGTHAEG